MNWKLDSILAILALVLFCGCGVGRPVLVKDRPEVKALLAQKCNPVLCQVRIAPAVVSTHGYMDTDAEQASQGNPAILGIEDAITNLLSDFELFGDVLSGKDEGRPYFELSAEITEYGLAYEGRNKAYIPNLIYWTFSPWGTWLIADENYSVSLNVKVCIKDADTGDKLWSEVIKAQVTEALNDYQRGAKSFSIFKIGKFTPENWKLVEKTLKPHILEDFKSKLLQRLLSAEVQGSLGARVAMIEYRRRPQVDWAVVVGINKCELLAERQPKWCKKSAKDFAGVLKSAGYKVFEIQDADITDIKETLRKAESQSMYRIRCLLFYYAGVGASEFIENSNSVKQYLFDSEGEKLSLEDLADLLENINAEERLIILDAGFILDNLGRGIRLNSIPRSATYSYPKKLTSGNCGFLSACSPGQGAAEDKKFKACLFTHYLLKSLADPACDSDNDGSISLQELVKSDPIRFDLPRHCQLEYDVLQTPFLSDGKANRYIFKK